MRWLTLLLLLSVANAATLAWTLPTRNTDGSAIPSGATLTVTVLEGPSGGPYTVVATGRTGLTYTLAATAGPCFEVEAVATGTEVGTSAPSNPACLAPAAASLTATPTVGTANSVYMEVRGADKFTLVAVGTVPTGTTCDPTQDVDGYDVVPNSAVTWAGNVQPPVVVAKCQ